PHGDCLTSPLPVICHSSKECYASVTPAGIGTGVVSFHHGHCPSGGCLFSDTHRPDSERKEFRLSIYGNGHGHPHRSRGGGSLAPRSACRPFSGYFRPSVRLTVSLRGPHGAVREQGAAPQSKRSVTIQLHHRPQL